MAGESWRVGAALKQMHLAMADNYQDPPFPTDAEHDRGAVRDESSLLAKLAQLSGQSDPFGTAAKTPLPLQSRANVRPQYAPAEAAASAPGSPPWMQRARQETPPAQEETEPEYPSPVHPLHRYAARQPQRQNRIITRHNKMRASSMA